MPKKLTPIKPVEEPVTEAVLEEETPLLPEEIFEEMAAEAKKSAAKTRAKDERIVKAGKKTKKKIYAEDEVRTIDPEMMADSEAEERRKTWLELVQSAKSGAVLEGTLESCRRTKNGEVLAIVSYKNATVYIPARHLMEFNDDKVRHNEDSGLSLEQEATNSLIYYVNQRFGMRVKFTVLQAYENDPAAPDFGPIAYASRVRALASIAKARYIDRDSTGKPFLYKGLQAEGVITFVAEKGVGIEVFGADAFIPSAELSHFYTADPRTDDKDFYIGKVLRVKIMDDPDVIEYSPKGSNDVYQLVHLRVSAKATQTDPNVKYFDHFEVGQRVLAQVTNSDNEDGIFVVLANKCSARCDFSKSFQNPPHGSLLNVKIVRKDEKTHRISCMIQNIIRMGPAYA